MQMILDGQKRWASDGRKIDVMNPATLEVFDSVPDEKQISIILFTIQ